MDSVRSRTLQCYNLSELVTEEHLYELFLQAGPLQDVKMVDSGSGVVGFIIFKHEVSVEYAKKIFDGTRLCNRPLEFQPTSHHRNEPNHNQSRQMPYNKWRHEQQPPTRNRY